MVVEPPNQPDWREYVARGAAGIGAVAGAVFGGTSAYVLADTAQATDFNPVLAAIGGAVIGSALLSSTAYNWARNTFR